MTKRGAVTAAYCGAIALLTLWPQAPGLSPTAPCLLCGDRGLADAILNMLLFVPAGLLLARARGAFVAVLGGILLSSSIEVAQLAVPGRHASPADVLFNGLGTVLGVCLCSSRHVLLTKVPLYRDSLAGAAAFAVGGVMFLTGRMLVPALPEPPYHAIWQPDRPGTYEWRGRLLGAAVGPYQARPGPLSYADAMSEMLRRGMPVGVAALGETPDGPVPLFQITAADDAVVLEIMIDAGDAVVFERLRASDWKLTTPTLRVPRAMTDIRSADTLKITTFRRRGVRCAEINGVRACRGRFTPGIGWSLLHGLGVHSQQTQHAFSAGWVALLLLPIGFLARRGTALLLVAALIWYMTIRLPVDSILAPAPWPQVMGAMLGAAIGVLLRRRIELAANGSGAHAHSRKFCSEV